MLDGSVKTVMVDDSKTVGELLVTICSRIGKILGPTCLRSCFQLYLRFDFYGVICITDQKLLAYMLKYLNLLSVKIYQTHLWYLFSRFYGSLQSQLISLNFNIQQVKAQSYLKVQLQCFYCMLHLHTLSCLENQIRFILNFNVIEHKILLTLKYTKT